MNLLVELPDRWGDGLHQAIEAKKIINSPKKQNGGGNNISRISAFIKVDWNDRNW
jgi:hypothetical protein